MHQEVHLEDTVQLVYPIGTLVNSILLITILSTLWGLHRRLKRIERLVTPEHTDEQGVRYYPPHDEVLVEDSDAELARIIHALRAKRKAELDQMEHQDAAHD